MQRMLWSLLACVLFAVPAFALTGGSHISVSGGTIAFTGLVTAAEGGTGAANTATLGRYLRADGTNFVTSSVAAAGAGTCTNQFVRATVDNATPTCAAVSLTADVTGTLPLANGGGLTTATDDAVVVGNGTILESKVLTNCTGAGKAVTYATASNTFGCNTITSGAAVTMGFGTGMDLAINTTVFAGLGGAVDASEAKVQAAVPAATWGNVRCVSAAIQGAGASHDVTVNGRAGACGSQVASGAPGNQVCTITGSASANQTCAETTNIITTTAGQCLNYSIISQSAVTNTTQVGCIVERLT